MKLHLSQIEQSPSGYKLTHARKLLHTSAFLGQGSLVVHRLRDNQTRQSRLYCDPKASTSSDLRIGHWKISFHEQTPHTHMDESTFQTFMQRASNCRRPFDLNSVSWIFYSPVTSLTIYQTRGTVLATPFVETGAEIL